MTSIGSNKQVHLPVSMRVTAVSTTQRLASNIHRSALHESTKSGARHVHTTQATRALKRTAQLVDETFPFLPSCVEKKYTCGLCLYVTSRNLPRACYSPPVVFVFTCPFAGSQALKRSRRQPSAMTRREHAPPSTRRVAVM